MNLRLLLACATLPAVWASAQTAAQPNDGSALAIDGATGAWTFSWWGASDRTYFIQHTEELGSPTLWQFLPVIERGADAALHYSFWLSPPPVKFFLRLRHTDAPVADPYAADFDGDGIPNGWELEHGLDPFDATDAALSYNGLTHLEIFQQSLGAGADPTTANAAALLVFTP